MLLVLLCFRITVLLFMDPSFEFFVSHSQRTTYGMVLIRPHPITCNFYKFKNSLYSLHVCFLPIFLIYLHSLAVHVYDVRSDAIFCHSFKKKSLTVFISFITKDKDYDVWGYEILLQSDAWNQNILFLTYKSGYINFDENGLFV